MAIKVLVVGGAGFIGGHLTKTLVDQGFEVHILDNLSGGKRERVPEGVKLHVVDICDLETIKPVFAGVDTVFHLAALPRVPYSIEHPVETNEVNVTGTVNVLVAAKEAGVRRVVYSASSSAYGDQEILPLVETMEARPKSPYGLQKYIGELYAKMFYDIYDLGTVSLRYFNVYGSGYSADGPYSLVIGKFLEQRKQGEPMTIVGDGSQTRDFTHVRDVVKANILAMQSEKVGAGEVINIGAGKNQSVKMIAEMIGGPVEFLPARLEPRDTRADNTKARELLGWTPEVSIEEGITELKKLAGLL